VKALIHVVPRAGAEESIEAHLRQLASELRGRPEAAACEVTAMFRLEKDPLGPRTPYRAALEIRTEAAGAAAFESLICGLGGKLDEVAHPDLSSMLIGEDIAFIPCERAPVRYQYLMRRNASFSHEAYLERYREIHSQFGLRTPGILGYVQFHVDAEASRQAAGRAGLGVWGVDSVSELHLESLESFLAAVTAEPDVAREAGADEEIFVDRRRSFDFCSRVDWPSRSEAN
jgi:hypothetical protein